MDITKLAEYGVTGIALAVVIALIYLFNGLVRFIDRQRCDYLSEIEKIEQRHVKVYKDLSGAIKKNTDVTEQTYQYIKLRNGHLEQVLKQNGKKYESK